MVQSLAQLAGELDLGYVNVTRRLLGFPCALLLGCVGAQGGVSSSQGLPAEPPSDAKVPHVLAPDADAGVAEAAVVDARAAEEKDAAVDAGPTVESAPEGMRLVPAG